MPTINSVECQKCENKTCSGKELNRMGFKVVKCKYGGAIKIIEKEKYERL